MKSDLIVILGLVFVIFCYASGIITSRYAHYEPTPHECVSVCVEQYEKMGC